MDFEVLRWAATTVASLFALVNPLNAVPLFAVMTTGLTDAQRNRQATRAGLFAGAILAVTAFAGAFIMQFFGISLGMLQIAGGLIVGQAAWAMVTGNPQVSRTETTVWAREKRFSLRQLIRGQRGEQAEEQPSATEQPAGPAPDDIAFSPVAMPVLAGPAAMGVVIGLTSQSATVTADLGIFAGIALIAALAVGGLRAANPILHTLGASGILALQRVFGFILLAIAVALVTNGISALFGIPLATG